jgi:hypothetical protein
MMLGLRNDLMLTVGVATWGAERATLEFEIWVPGS